MLALWFKCINAVLHHPADKSFYLSGKKIARGVQVVTKLKYLLASETDFTLDMMGYHSKKLRMLRELYLNQASREAALRQLQLRREKGSYGSTGMTCYNHYEKKNQKIMGPCIQSVVLTHRKKGVIDVDVFYRTTEIFKKFGADLIFLKELLEPFKITSYGTLTFHFANATYHPMYWVVASPYLDDPTATLREIKTIDPQVWLGILRWTVRYTRQEPALSKFKQGERVSKHLHRLLPRDKLVPLAAYIEKYLPPKRTKL